MPSPIALFVYNRPQHTRQTIDALRANAMAQDSVLYIFSDAAKNENAKPAVQQVRNYIHSLESLAYFKTVIIIEATENQGLAASIISGVTYVLSLHHRIIVLEDDLITSPYFLTYMNGALDYYADQKTIGSISGFTCPVRALKHYKHDVYLDPKGECWGWATWEDRWLPTDWDVKDYAEFKNSSQIQRSFNKLQFNLSEMLIDQMEGRIHSWAVRWVYSLFVRDLLTVYPSKSFIGNTGFDGSGTNCAASGANSFEKGSILNYFPNSFHYEMLSVNRRIMHQVAIYERESFSFKVKRKLKKLLF